MKISICTSLVSIASRMAASTFNRAIACFPNVCTYTCTSPVCLLPRRAWLQVAASLSVWRKRCFRIFFFLLSNQFSLADVTPLEISPQSFKWIDWEELYLHSSALSRANHIWIMAAEWNIKAVCIPACLLPIHLSLWCIRGRRKKKPYSRTCSRSCGICMVCMNSHTLPPSCVSAREWGRRGWWGGHAIPIFFSAAHECYILSDSTLSHSRTSAARRHR